MNKKITEFRGTSLDAQSSLSLLFSSCQFNTPPLDHQQSYRPCSHSDRVHNWLFHPRGPFSRLPSRRLLFTPSAPSGNNNLTTAPCFASTALSNGVLCEKSLW